LDPDRARPQLEHLPSLDYTADNSSKQLPLQGIKLTEDVIKDVQRDLTKEEDLSCTDLLTKWAIGQ
jgi:hypothetical protein